MPGRMEWVFQQLFAQSEVYVRASDETEWRYLGHADAQPQQGEENTSHRDGGSYLYRLYLPTGVSVPRDGYAKINGAIYRIVGRPRVNQDAPNITACTIVDVERWEG